MATKKKDLDYDTAFAELQTIVQKLQSDNLGIEQLGIDIKRAHELSTFCKKRLKTIETDLAKIIE